MDILEKEKKDYIFVDKHRHIFVPCNLKEISVVGDKNAVPMKCVLPRFFEGVDLSQYSCVIRFTNANKEYGEEKKIDVIVDDNEITLLWKFSNAISTYRGYVFFTIQFEGADFQWQTTRGTLFVRPALPLDSTTMSEKDDSSYRQLATQVSDLTQKINNLNLNNVVFVDTTQN